MNEQLQELRETVTTQGREIMTIRNEADQKWIEISGKDVPVSIITYLTGRKKIHFLIIG